MKLIPRISSVKNSVVAWSHVGTLRSADAEMVFAQIPEISITARPWNPDCDYWYHPFMHPLDQKIAGYSLGSGAPGLRLRSSSSSFIPIY